VGTLDANPLTDISNTKKISAGLINGRYLPKQRLQQLLDEVEALAKKN